MDSHFQIPATIQEIKFILQTREQSSVLQKPTNFTRATFKST